MGRDLRALGLGLAAALLGAAAAEAQTSLFNQPPAAQPAPPAAGEAQPDKPKARPKPRGPTPARALTVTNASSNALTSLEISGDGKSASLSKPLAPKGRTTLRLPALKGCVVSVAAAFEGSGEAQASDFNVCKEKTIRFTD